MNVCIVQTGTANTASMKAALQRAGAEVTITADATAVRSAPVVVLPGVGSFASGMAAMEGDLGEAIRERVASRRPLLAVCLGLQLLCERSHESPGVAGLGLIAGTLERFESVVVPQLGWNQVTPSTSCQLLRSGYAYFANSYRLTSVDGWAAAESDHGGSFVAAVECGPVLGCQFHPELSGAWGQSLIERWLEEGSASC